MYIFQEMKNQLIHHLKESFPIPISLSKEDISEGLEHNDFLEIFICTITHYQTEGYIRVGYLEDNRFIDGVGVAALDVVLTEKGLQHL